jgi:2-polyprenyl-3-methyl-5-hydroxy-6-metoxy-1,4-benzoquinol methylase
MNPRMNQAATHAFYNSDVNAIYNETKFDQVSSATQMDDQINLRNLEMIDRFRRGEKGTLLEIGSAKGFFLAKARERGYTVYGLELNQKNYQYSRARLGDNIVNVDLLDAHFDSNKFDVVYMRDVIEHIPTPKLFFQEVCRVTKPGGILFVDTHNINGWIYKIVRERHTVIFGFEHPVHWSPRTLRRLLLQNSFMVRKISQASLDFTMVQILYYFLSPSFTTIYPKPVSRISRFMIRRLLFPFRFKLLYWLDKNTLPNIANFFGRGSVMKVIAEKVK